MTGNHFQNIEQLEGSLWEAADQLRANSKLTSSEYCMPVLGIIFLRHATNRYNGAVRQIEADQAAGKMPKRPLIQADFLKRRALMLPREARYDEILKLPKGAKLGTALVEAMEAIEKSFEPLLNQLPKDYEKFENDLLEHILRIFDSETLRTATGDVFGRIYEYFLMKFAMQGAQDNGEFFTPPSLVQTIVNVIEPEHGVVADLACGSGGMFVQTSHFLEGLGQDTTHRVTFFGQEKTATTIRLAKMNLAVHGLEGDIREANTFYDDVHRLADGKPLWGHCDFVMANPPFNVDMVDAEKVKDDRRLPFGLPGVNKGKKVSNANYLWISYFHSYLGGKGRAGFVMSSQASSAGHGEAEVRRKIVESGAVDVMISIRSNFFYTRTVPCELWFFDKGKPNERRDQVLMLDARHIFRKVTRKIYDFSPEQLADLTAIVWLYRGETKRFAALLNDYREKCRKHRRALVATLPEARDVLRSLGTAIRGCDTALSPEYQAMTTAFADECGALEKQALKRDYTKDSEALPDFAAACRALLHRLREMRRVAEPLAAAGLDNAERKEAKKELKTERERADEAWTCAVTEAEANIYFTRHLEWLRHRFPEGCYHDVPGLCKVVALAEIAAADWSLTPGRYVGVAAAEVDEDFDFDQTMQDIHAELSELNAEAAELAGKIEANIKDLLG
jgi:type I restriction enzyme M protein